MEETIIHDFSQGSQTAFRHIFDQYYPKVLSFALGLLKNHDDAEDVAQTVFIKMWSKREMFLQVENFDSYLYSLTRNTTLNFIAGRKMNDSLQMADIVGSSSPHDDLIAHDLQLLTDLIVSEMPSQRQTIYRMSREQGLTNDEIASRLGIQKKTVENHLNLALGTLRKSILYNFLLYSIGCEVIL
jgi:RNA polymerase sigma-70 factor (ECF subfamily)